jgi:hypothetical protein
MIINPDGADPSELLKEMEILSAHRSAIKARIEEHNRETHPRASSAGA